MKRPAKALLAAILLAALAVPAIWLANGYNGWAGKACYTLLCPLGVDTWFPAETVVELSEDARDADLARRKTCADASWTSTGVSAWKKTRTGTRRV